MLALPQQSDALGGPSKSASLLTDIVLCARHPQRGAWRPRGRALAELAVRELQTPDANRFSADLFRRIARLSSSTDACEKLGAVYAILELVEVPLGESLTRLARFAGCLHSILGHTCEPRLAEAASAALGRLVQFGGALVAEVVEREARTL
jgi:FKBP12-rapamycin complex-associated protein